MTWRKSFIIFIFLFLSFSNILMTSLVSQFSLIQLSYKQSNSIQFNSIQSSPVSHNRHHTRLGSSQSIFIYDEQIEAENYVFLSLCLCDSKTPITSIRIYDLIQPYRFG